MGVSPIDFSQLEHYVAGDRGVILELLALFNDQARTVMAQLDPVGPVDQWRNAAHSLKGSSLGIGALALAEACGEAEMAREASLAIKQAARARIAECLGAALSDIALYTGRQTGR
jgi:HPt (histidine-containing phosphotransfer) domain-containing protein